MFRSLFGLVAAGVVIGTLVVGVRALRRRFFGGLAGPPRLLADIVMLLSLVVVTAQVLGTFGALNVAALTVALVVVGTVAWRVGRGGSGSLPPERSPEPPEPRTGRVAALVAAVAAGLLVAAWVPRVIDVYRRGGPTSIDSLWYHLPIAARFAQSGSVLHPVFVTGDALETYYPDTSELFHALGIVFLGHDTLTPALNVLWLGLALLGAWCLGRPFGVSPLTFTAVALVLGGPQLVMYEAGQGLNDLFGIAFTITAFAILANTWNGRDWHAGVVYAGLAMGLAVSSKYTLLGVAAALTIGVIAGTRRGNRAHTGVLWCGALFATGSYWYIRNLIAVGNPLPEVHFSVGPFTLPSIEVVGVSTVWKVLHRPGTWGRFFVPGFRYALGPVWWAVLVFALVGLLFGALSRDARLRLLGLVGAVGLVAYVFSPQLLGLYGNAAFFNSNVRYMAVPVVLGVLALSITVGSRGPRFADLVAVVLGVAIVATQFDANLWPFGGRRPPELGLPSLSSSELAVGIVAGAISLAAIAGVLIMSNQGVGSTPGVDRLTRASVIAVGVVALVGGFLALDTFFVGRRYAKVPFLTNVYAWAQHVQDKRIGFVGTIFQYPLTGKDASNYVQFVDERPDNRTLTPITNCAAWRRELNRERFNYVLITTPGFPLASSATAPELAWTRTDPHARLVVTDSNGTGHAMLFELNGPTDPRACATLSQAGR